jgi:hypothetical protein
MPMVVMNDGVNESSLKRSKQHDLPTPESPMRSSLICQIVSARDGEQSARRSSGTTVSWGQDAGEVCQCGERPRVRLTRKS